MKGYLMYLKDRSVWRLGPDGEVLHDGSRGMDFQPPHDSWRILGFTTRHFSNRVISLQEAAAGESIGQGWVHDLDHGSHRMWAMPKYRRAVRVVKLSEQESEE